MEKILQNIADIQFGSSVKRSKNKKIICFQVSDIREDGSVRFDKLIYTDHSKVENSDFLKPEDILLPAKGNKLTAVIVNESFLPAVASSSLFVIRIKDELITPEYLQWFLNLSRTQWELQKFATGSNIPSLSIRGLRKFKISIPAVNVQQKISKLRALQRREEHIVTKVSEQRKRLIEAVTKKIITNDSNS